MRYERDPAVDALATRQRELAAFAERSRDLPPLNPETVKQHVDSHGGSAAKARANLAGLIGSQAPHERRVGDDSHITGRVGGREQRRPARTIWIDDKGHVKRIRYNQGITRPGRPINARGFTSLHFAFEAINKAHLELGRTNAQGRKVSSDDHIIYIEREEAAAELLDALKPAAPSAAEDFLEYQERDSAVADATDAEDGKAIFTNIKGSKADRIAVFSGLAELEKIEREPSLEIDLRRSSALMTKIREQLEPGKTLEKFSGNAAVGKLAVRGADAETVVRVIRSLGWRDRRKKDERVRRTPDKFGICHDPGKCGHVQFRLVGELPHEIDDAGRVRIIKGMCAEFKERGLPYIAVMHAPGSTNDDRNWHFHLVYHDRPVSIFDGTAATHLRTNDANGDIPASVVNRKARWLNEPSIQAQKGKWDFQVRGTWIAKSRNRRHVYPYVQRKDRTVTRKDFVPGLRKKLCDLTNAELERYGIERRVDPLKHAEAGRNAVPGKKLLAADHSRELAGIPTARGSENERMQAIQRMDALEDEDAAISQRAHVTDEEEAKARLKISDRGERISLLGELMSCRRDIAQIRNIARKAGEHVERLQSRSSAMVDRNCKLILAEYKRSPSGSPKLQDLRRQVEHAQDHLQGMRSLAGELFQLPIEAERHIMRLGARAADLEIRAGLREKPVFQFDIAEDPVSQVDHAVQHAKIDTTEPQDRPGHETADGSAMGPRPTRMPPITTAVPPSTPSKTAAHQADARSKAAASADRRQRKTGAQIDIIVKDGVPFELERGVLGDGRGVLVATIGPADCERHGLPSQIILVTQDEKSRLTTVGREREMQATSGDRSLTENSEMREGSASGRGATGTPAESEAVLQETSPNAAHGNGQPSNKDGILNGKQGDVAPVSSSDKTAVHTDATRASPSVGASAASPSVAVESEPDAGAAPPSGDTHAPTKESEPGKTQNTIGRVVDADPSAVASSVKLTSGGSPVEGDPAGESPAMPEQQPDREAASTAPSRNAGSRALQSSTDTAHRVEGNDLAHDTAHRDVQAQAVETTVANLILRAEHRRIVLYPDPNGRIFMHSREAKAAPVAARLAEPLAQKRLRPIAEAQYKELEMLADIAAADPGSLEHFEGEMRVAGDAPTPSAMLMKRWVNNEEVQQALDQMARLSPPNRHDEAEIARRRDLFPFLIMGKQEAFDEIDRMVAADLDRGGMVPFRGDAPAPAATNVPEGQGRKAVTQAPAATATTSMSRKVETVDAATNDEASRTAERERDGSSAKKKEWARKQQLLDQARGFRPGM